MYELVAQAVVRANEDVPESVRVRRFALLHKQLDADDEELTRTRKVRRGTINDRYGDIIRALDDTDADAVTVASTVTYQDGSQVEREITLRIAAVDGRAPAAEARRRIAIGARR